MRTKGRRRLDRILLGVGAVVGGGIVAIGAAVGDAERIPQMWVGAELSAEGGTAGRPRPSTTTSGSSPSTGSSARSPGSASTRWSRSSSATAPDDIAAFTPIFIDGEQGMEVKVGDPNTTITGRHRYLLDYELPRDVLLDAADTLAWDAVGTKWTVDIQRAEIHIVAPWELVNATCHVGTSGSDGRLRAPGGRAGPPRHDGRGPRARAKASPSGPSEAPRWPPRPTSRRRPRRRRPIRASACSCPPSRPPPPASAPPCPPRRWSAARDASAWASAASPTRPSPAADPTSEVRLDETDLARDGHHRLRAARPSSPRPRAACSTPSGCCPPTRWRG